MPKQKLSLWLIIGSLLTSLIILALPGTLLAADVCPTICADTEFCSGTTCTTKRADQSACENSVECQSGTCTNKICVPATSGAGGTTTPGGTSGNTTPGGTSGATTPGGTDGTPAKSVSKLPNPIGVTNFNDLFAKLIKYIIGFTGSVALAVFIYGGVMYLVSAGRQDYLAKAKKAVTQAIFGLIIVFSSYLIVKLIISISEIGVAASS